MSNQLIKTTEQGKENVFPRTRIQDLFDDISGQKLIDILRSFNMMFVPYLGNKSYTRNQISPELRRQGLWLTYVIDNTVYTEWYGEVAIDDTNWGNDSNWRQGSNALVGDLSISPNGTWVINGEDSGITIKGDKGDSPVIRIYDNKIQVSYDKGVTYEDLNNTPVYTKFRFNSQTNTYQVSYDLGANWQDISDEKVYHKFKYNQATNTYQESIDFGKTWSNISAEKVYYQFRYNAETNTHQVSTDLGQNWTDVSSNKVYYQFRTNDNKLQVSTDLGTTWENCSEPIAAWFRWADTSGTGNVGKIQISRDNSTWDDLSPNITNNLYIKGYVSTVGELPTGSAAIGDIYMVGPTYDESDTTQDYPHYRMWVKQSSGWVDNGEYQSNVQISQTTGQETGITMSQKAITKAIEAETARAKAAEQAIIFDVSAHNDGAVFESLQALLSSSDLDTLIPVSFRHGGMTIRFIQGSEQSSDNKYVQYRLMSTAWSTNVSDWQGVDDEPTIRSRNLVKSSGVRKVLDYILYSGQNYNPIFVYDSVKEVNYGIRDSSFSSIPQVSGKTYLMILYSDYNNWISINIENNTKLISNPFVGGKYEVYQWVAESDSPKTITYITNIPDVSTEYVNLYCVVVEKNEDTIIERLQELHTVVDTLPTNNKVFIATKTANIVYFSKMNFISGHTYKARITSSVNIPSAIINVGGLEQKVDLVANEDRILTYVMTSSSVRIPYLYKDDLTGCTITFSCQDLTEEVIAKEYTDEEVKKSSIKLSTNQQTSTVPLSSSVKSYIFDLMFFKKGHLYSIQISSDVSLGQTRFTGGLSYKEEFISWGSNDISKTQYASFISDFDGWNNIWVYTNNVNTPTDMTLIVTDVTNSMEEIPLYITQGWISGGGNDAGDDDQLSIRTQKIYGSGLFFVVLPNELKSEFNGITNSDYSSRSNTTSYAPYSIKVNGNDNFFRASFQKKDGSNILVGDELVQQIHVYRLYKSISEEYDVVVASSNSLDRIKLKSDIVTDGINDTEILASIFNCKDSIKAFIRGGEYAINKFYDIPNNCRIALPLMSSDSQYQWRKVTIHGEFVTSPFSELGTRFKISEGTHNLIDDDNYEYKVIGVENVKDVVTTTLEFTGMTIRGHYYDKKIVYVDLHQILSSMLTGINIRSSYQEGYSVFNITPKKGLVGIRVGRGSNYGIQNYVKNCNIWYCYIGLSCAGEHFVFEDVKTHHDYIGWAFGDYTTIGHFEHPNVMIGCSIEGCYRLMLLTKMGVMEEGEFVSDSSANMFSSTLVCIGLSTEEMWEIPLDEREEGGPTTQRTLPILEVLKGAYRGSIELDTATNVFETGSGRAFTWRKYIRGQTILGHGNTVDNIYQ